jgi:hypothetical protein
MGPGGFGFGDAGNDHHHPCVNRQRSIDVTEEEADHKYCFHFGPTYLFHASSQ